MLISAESDNLHILFELSGIENIRKMLLIKKGVVNLHMIFNILYIASVIFRFVDMKGNRPTFWI